MINIFKRKNETDILRILAIIKKQQECLVDVAEIITDIGSRINALEEFVAGQKTACAKNAQTERKKKK